MIASGLGFLLLYLLICAIPALVLLARGRGWRPRFVGVTLLIGWTGGGWMIMLWLAVTERSENFTRGGPLPPPSKKPETYSRSRLL